MKEYINKMIAPYVQRNRKELKLFPSHPVLPIYGEYKGQLTPDIISLFEAIQIFVVEVPPNCADYVQPPELLMTSAVKEFLRKIFNIATLVK